MWTTLPGNRILGTWAYFWGLSVSDSDSGSESWYIGFGLNVNMKKLLLDYHRDENFDRRQNINSAALTLSASALTQTWHTQITCNKMLKQYYWTLIIAFFFFSLSLCRTPSRSCRHHPRGTASWFLCSQRTEKPREHRVRHREILTVDHTDNHFMDYSPRITRTLIL